MKKIALAIFTVISLICTAQNRVDNPEPELSFKSQSIKKALYWETDNGKWKSRKCNKRVYLGEGVDVDNFESLFIGEYSGRRYLFLDKYNYYWRYPNLEYEWMCGRTMHIALLSDADWKALQNLEFGKPYIVTPRFTNKMLKGHEEYSFPFFLSLSETLLSSSETMYNSYLNHEGESVAEAYWKENYPAIPFIIVKRVDSDNGDVVRFRFGSVIELIDSFYFEIPYSEWGKLFVADKIKSYE